MKNLKKLFSVLLVLVLSLFTINTFANETVKGSITVNKTVEGKVYDIYKIFDLTYKTIEKENEDDVTLVSYSISEKWETFFSGAGKDYIVDLEKDEEGNVINPKKLNPITVGTETKYINITDDNIVEFTQKALDNARGVKVDDSKTATGTSLTFDNLELGYYLVYPQGATEKTEDSSGSIASISSTVPTATVNVKAKYPEIDKELTNGHTFNVGEYANFKITGKVPDTTGFETYTYQINDTWTAGLELDKANVDFKVTIAGEEINVKPVYTENGFTLTIDMTDYQTKETQDEQKVSLVGEAVVVSYKLKVTKEAIDSENTKNSATLTYSNNPKTNTTTTTTPEEEYVYSSKVVVTKVDGADKITTLSGATFVLMNGNKFYKAVMDGEKLVKVEWEDSIDNATKYTTGEDGIISFEGLKDGSYKLVETEAPLGYNKLPQPVEVEVNCDYDDNQKAIPVVTEKTVENNTGTELPSTGGFGTTMFIMIGSLLAVLSMVVLVTNKRMAKEYL